MLYNQEETRSHYGEVVQTNAPLYYERFDQHMLDKRPRVRELVGTAFARLFPEKVDELLDVGCGTGFYFPLLAEHATRLTGVDVCGPMLEQARELIREKELDNCQVRECSALDLSLDDASIDVAFSWDFLHHVADLPQALAEIHRVLKPGGRYVAVEPNVLNPSILWYHLRRRSEWRLLTQNQFQVPRMLRKDFEVGVSYDNTIISFLDDRTWKLWKLIDRTTSFPPLHLVSFRYVLNCHKRVGGGK